MDNQKVFTIFAITMIAGTATVITAAVTLQGGSFPPVIYLIEHVVLSLLLRSAYKSFDGTNWLARGMDLIGLTVQEVAAEPTAPDAATSEAVAVTTAKAA
jgi:hypothetical protein